MPAEPLSSPPIDLLTKAASDVVRGLSLPRTLQSIADVVRELVGAKYAALGVPSDEGGLRAFITSGLHPAMARGIEHEPEGLGLLGALLETDYPIRLEDLSTDPRSSGFCKSHPFMKRFLGVPVIGRNHKRLGNLYLCDRLDDQPFDENDERLVVFFANFAAIAIENARLHQQLQAVALHNERDRIGMELHDGVIQEIYAVGMKLEIMRGKSHLPPEEELRFQSIVQDLNGIIDNIRGYIRDLRSPDDAQSTTFQQQITNLAEHFRDFSGVEVVLEISEELPALTDAQRHSLSQIVREGLANIARHAKASRAEVIITTEDDDLYLTIRDNGVGFDTAEMNSQDHFGLRNMEQRAMQLRGFMQIESNPQQGTTIRLVMPLKRPLPNVD
jgi:signal transduction histidine kinase